MAVLKQTSPTAWPSAPRPKPSSTVPSASTRSAVGLRSGQADEFSGIVMSALHSRRIRPREPQKTQIHMGFPAYLTGRGAVLSWVPVRVAFSSEVDTGSREENASKQEARVGF